MTQLIKPNDLVYTPSETEKVYKVEPNGDEFIIDYGDFIYHINAQGQKYCTEVDSWGTQPFAFLATPENKEKLELVYGELEDIACHYSGDRVALLDALCDQIVTAIGIGVMLGFDMEKALAEVNRSNYTKFKPYDGGYLPYIQPDGKIGKNPNTYKEPQLEQFIGD